MTKIQEQRKARYRTQLRKCGFRSWRRANIRRYALIEKKVAKTISEDEDHELALLQKLADCWQMYRAGDGLGRTSRRLKRLAAHLLPRP